MKPLLFAALSVTLTCGLGAAAFSAPVLSPPTASPAELAKVREKFQRGIAMSYLPSRSGDLFFLSQKYFPVMFESGDYSHDSFSHYQGQTFKHTGATHGSSWDYDTHIPLVFYGPGLVKTGQEISTPATQQDLVPTYAKLMGAVPPRDAFHGQSLSAPFEAKAKPPKAILTIVFDQGGWQYYQAHPKAWPHVKNLLKQGSSYTQAHVTHLDAETAVGHIGIGTGAYPYQHGIISNKFYLSPLGERFSLLGPDQSPIFINSPSLADVWDLQKGNQPLIISYAYADRAAIGMAGHGSMYAGGDKDKVFYYDRKSGGLMTNSRYYELPDYLKDLRIQPHLQRLLAQDRNKQGKWFGHDVNNLLDVNKTPAQVDFDTEVFLKTLANEPVGQDEVTDLVYWTQKASDACGHAFGSESDECGQVFARQDQALKQMIDAFLAKVEPGRALVVLTADHGGTPLTHFSKGGLIKAEQVKADLNKTFDKLDNGVDLVYDMLASQFYVDKAELARNGLHWEDLRKYLLQYKVDDQPAFLEVLTRREVTELQLKYGLQD